MTSGPLPPAPVPSCPSVRRKPGRRGPFVKVRGVVLPADEPTPVDQYVPAAEPGLIAALGATWTLMQIPTGATPRQVTGAGGSGRHWQNQQRTVSIIDLRRLEHRDTGATDNAGRAYRHRWYVRGHWREQAHGPRQTLRRPTWIPGYIKGPPGAPLLELERVKRLAPLKTTAPRVTHSACQYFYPDPPVYPTAANCLGRYMVVGAGSGTRLGRTWRHRLHPLWGSSHRLRGLFDAPRPHSRSSQVSKRRTPKG
jgi:hypothetical protein